MILQKIKFKKAQTGGGFDIFMFIIIAFLVVLFFAAYIYITGMINNVFQQVGIANEVNAGNPVYVNMSSASESIFGQMNQSIQALRMVAIVYILSFGVGIVITNALIKKHPIWFFVYVLVSALAVIFSAPVSNAYETLLSSNVLGGELSTFTASNFVLLNLPVIVMVISILGGIFLFIQLLQMGGNPDNF